MKIRDLVLLLAGGVLVVFGMVVGDLLENDAFADDHAKTELSELELKQKVKSAESKIINLEKELESAKNENKVVEYEYTIIWLMLGNKKWYIKVGHNGQEKVAYKYNKDPVEEFPTFLELQLEALLRVECKDGWVYQETTTNGKYYNVILKRVKKITRKI